MRIALLCSLCLTVSLSAQEAGSKYTGPQLISAMKAAQPTGAGDAKVRLTLKQEGKPTLQIQVKRRRTAEGENLHLYQVLFPAGQKNEGLLLKVKGKSVTGMSYKPGGKPTALAGDIRSQGLFGTDLLVEDLLTDYLDWPEHKVIGTEKIKQTLCTIVESTPAAGSRAQVKKAKCWMDEARMCPRKVEFLNGAGKVLRTVETLDTVRSKGHIIPVELSITTAATGSTTNVKGTGFNDDVTFDDADFTEQGLIQGVGRKE